MAASTPAAGAWNSTSRRSIATAPTTASTCCAAWPRRAACRRQVALAWLLAQPVVSSVIIGAKRVDQLDDNLAAVGLALTADELAELDKVSALPPSIRAGCTCARASTGASSCARPAWPSAPEGRARAVQRQAQQRQRASGFAGNGRGARADAHRAAPDRKARPADRPRSRSPARPQAAPRGRHAPAAPAQPCRKARGAIHRCSSRQSAASGTSA